MVISMWHELDLNMQQLHPWEASGSLCCLCTVTPLTKSDLDINLVWVVNKRIFRCLLYIILAGQCQHTCNKYHLYRQHVHVQQCCRIKLSVTRWDAMALMSTLWDFLLSLSCIRWQFFLFVAHKLLDWSFVQSAHLDLLITYVWGVQIFKTWVHWCSHSQCLCWKL